MSQRSWKPAPNCPVCGALLDKHGVCRELQQAIDEAGDCQCSECRLGGICSVQAVQTDAAYVINQHQECDR